MAEQEHSAGGVTIKTGDKDVGTQALEKAPIVGNAIKAYDEVDKASEDGSWNASETTKVASEASGLIQSCTGTATAIATDPIGWLVGQGLDFLLTVVQPLQDAIHFVSGDGPALAQGAGNFANIGKGVADLKDKFDTELKESLQNWGGEASELAGSKLAEFGKGIDGVAAQAGDISAMLQKSSMVMTVIEDFIKALLTELISWLIMIWVPALASAVVTGGASTAAASTATAGKAAATGGRVSRMISKLQDVLSAIWQFLKKVTSNVRNLKTGVRKAMDNKRALSETADASLSGGKAPGLRQPIQSMRGSDGAVGSRLDQGFRGSMGNVATQTGLDQMGGSGADKPLRNISSDLSADSADDIGTDHSESETNDHLGNLQDKNE